MFAFAMILASSTTPVAMAVRLALASRPSTLYRGEELKITADGRSDKIQATALSTHSRQSVNGFGPLATDTFVGMHEPLARLMAVQLLSTMAAFKAGNQCAACESPSNTIRGLTASDAVILAAGTGGQVRTSVPAKPDMQSFPGEVDVGPLSLAAASIEGMTSERGSTAGTMRGRASRTQASAPGCINT